MATVTLETLDDLQSSDLVEIIPHQNKAKFIKIIDQDAQNNLNIIGTSQGNFIKNQIATVKYVGRIVQCTGANLLPGNKYYLNNEGKLVLNGNKFIGIALTDNQLLFTSGLANLEADLESELPLFEKSLTLLDLDYSFWGASLVGQVNELVNPYTMGVSLSLPVKGNLIPTVLYFDHPFRTSLNPADYRGQKYRFEFYISDQPDAPSELGDVITTFETTDYNVDILPILTTEFNLTMQVNVPESSQILVPDGKILTVVMYFFNTFPKVFSLFTHPQNSCIFENKIYSWITSSSGDSWVSLTDVVADGLADNQVWALRVLGETDFDLESKHIPVKTDGIFQREYRFFDISKSGTQLIFEQNPHFQHVLDVVDPGFSSKGNFFLEPKDFIYYDGIAELDLPFQFNYYGQNYNKIYISSNGVVSFEPFKDITSHPKDLCTPKSNFELPSDKMIALFWQWNNLRPLPEFSKPQEGPQNKIFYQFANIDEMSALVIQWNQVIGAPQYWQDARIIDLVVSTFQGILFSDGTVEVNILDINSPTIGVVSRQYGNFYRNERAIGMRNFIDDDCQGFTHIIDKEIPPPADCYSYFRFRKVSYRLLNGFSDCMDVIIGPEGPEGPVGSSDPIYSTQTIIRYEIVGDPNDPEEPEFLEINGELPNIDNRITDSSLIFVNWRGIFPNEANSSLTMPVWAYEPIREDKLALTSVVPYNIKNDEISAPDISVFPFDIPIDVVILNNGDTLEVPTGPVGDAVFDFIDISETGIELMDPLDQIDLDFDFNFGGEVKTRLFACKEGYITFDEPVIVFPVGTFCQPVENPSSFDMGIPTEIAPASAIFACWRQNPLEETGKIYYQTIGEEGDRIMIIQWNDVGENNNKRTFQLKLFETGEAESHLLKDDFIISFSNEERKTLIGMQETIYTGYTNYNTNVRNPAESAYRIPTHVSVPIDFEDISETGTNILVKSDQIMYNDPIDIGFDFPFYDRTFNKLWVNSSGYVTFKDPGFNQLWNSITAPGVNFEYRTRASYLTQEVSFPRGPWNIDNYVIFVNWTFIQDDVEISYQFINDENPRFIIQWNNVPVKLFGQENPLIFNNGCETEGFATFQLKLFQNGGLGKAEVHILENAGDNRVADKFNRYQTRLIGSIGSTTPDRDTANISSNTLVFRDYYDQQVLAQSPNIFNNTAYDIPISVAPLKPAGEGTTQYPPNPKLFGPKGPRGSIGSPISTPAFCGIGEIVNGVGVVEADWVQDGQTSRSIIMTTWRNPNFDVIKPVGQLRVTSVIPGVSFTVQTMNQNTGFLLDTGPDPIPFSWFAFPTQFYPGVDLPIINNNNNSILNKKEERSTKSIPLRNDIIDKIDRTDKTNELNKIKLGHNHRSEVIIGDDIDLVGEKGFPGPIDATNCVIYSGKGTFEFTYPLKGFVVEEDWITENTVVIVSNRDFIDVVRNIFKVEFNVVVENGKFTIHAIDKNNDAFHLIDQSTQRLFTIPNEIMWMAVNSNQ